MVWGKVVQQNSCTDWETFEVCAGPAAWLCACASDPCLSSVASSEMQMAVARILKGGRVHWFAVGVPHSGSIIGFSTIFYNKVTPNGNTSFWYVNHLIYIFHVGVMHVSHRKHLEKCHHRQAL